MGGALTDENHQQQAEPIQVDVGVGEGVAEGSVDDDEQHGAADGPKWRLPPLQPVLHKTPAHLGGSGQVSPEGKAAG